MTRFSRLTVAPVAALVLAWCGSAVAAEGQAGVAGGVAAYSPSYLMVPGYWILSREEVQKEIGLSDEQKEKLEAIGKKYYEQMRQDYQRQPAIKWQELSEVERKKKTEEMRKRASEAAKKRQETLDSFKEQVEKVLSAEQLSALKEIEFRQRASSMLRNPQVLEAIGASKKQKTRLENNQQQLNTKMRELQRKAGERALGVLTDEQLEKLRKLHQEGYRSVWQQGQPQGNVKIQVQRKPKAEKKPDAEQ